MKNPRKQSPTAGKLTSLWCLCACCVAIFSAAFALTATPAVALESHGIEVQSLEASATEKPTAEQEAKGELGSLDVQAGSHPYVLTTSLLLSKPEELHVEGEHYFRLAGGGLKDLQFELPPGFVGNPNATPKCAYKEFSIDSCPNDTAIGEATTKFLKFEGYENLKGEEVPNYLTVSDPVYNVEPPGGIPAEFGYFVKNIAPVVVDVSVRTGGDYGLTATVHNAPESIPIYAGNVKIWGVPADPRHNLIRGTCLNEAESNTEEEEIEGFKHNEERSEGECPVNIPVQPLLTNPTSCGEPRLATARVDSWEEPGIFSSKTATLTELSGCEKLDFSPTLTVTPDGSAGSTPTGLSVDVHVPQESTTNPVGLGEADVSNTTVALPPGTSVSPAAADGLQACTGTPTKLPAGTYGTPSDEIGFEGSAELDPLADPGVQTLTFSPKLPSLVQPGVNFCPDASKIASVRIKTPLLEGELTGSVYLAAPQNFTFAGAPEENPFRSLIAMYLVAEEPATGVLVKLPGKVSLCESVGQVLDEKTCEAPGQIITSFEHTPELPFSDLKLEFFGTARAPLTTPALCGTHTATSSFTPWSAPESGPPATPSSSFQITSGPATVSEPNGTPCPGATLPFSPTLHSSVADINAGSFSSLTTTLSREDGNQNIQSVVLHYPAGLSGILTGIPLCGEAEANAGTCSSASEIGETIVSVGDGGDPFSVTGGKVYLTGPYDGAPFGLSIVNPAKAGPFVLQQGRPVIVRAKIEINPLTAALTVTATGIPTIIEGIPLQIKHVNVNITGPGGNNKFTFNPTSCDPTNIEGTINSAEGASSPVKIPFQVTNCAQLKFDPIFTASTSAKDSFNDLGASLTTRVAEPKIAQGTEADIAKVKVELPVALPSRLTTLQKACIAKVFEANPANCPPDSFIGHAVVHTQLLPVPLEGPAIFVSHGGEAFPSLIIVLQGYGVKIDLIGTTFISKTGITSTTFKTVPDQPFETFELTLPTGKFSALAALTNVCKPVKAETVKKQVSVKRHGKTVKVTKKVSEKVAAPLLMPTEFTAQNGAEFKQTTKISVEGCKKTTVKKAAKKKKKGKKKK
jgi:hypothetical protein